MDRQIEAHSHGSIYFSSYILHGSNYFSAQSPCGPPTTQVSVTGQVLLLKSLRVEKKGCWSLQLKTKKNLAVWFLTELSQCLAAWILWVLSIPHFHYPKHQFITLTKAKKSWYNDAVILFLCFSLQVGIDRINGIYLSDGFATINMLLHIQTSNSCPSHKYFIQRHVLETEKITQTHQTMMS